MSTSSQISFAEGVRPLKIYAYTTAQYEDTPWRGGREGRGLIKVGDTTRPDAVTRIVEQLEGVLMPEAPEYKVLVVESAITDAGEAIRDHVVHAELVRAGVHR